MEKPTGFFDGKKMHLLVALPLGLVALFEGVLKIDVPGVTLDENWLMVLLGALGISSGRDMVRKLIEGFAGK